jgi:hypothetical protein
MNNLNELKNLLSVAYDAKKQLFGGLALYKFKTLFDGLIVTDMIDLSSEHGEQFKISLTAKTKNLAMKHIVFACSSLESTIKKLDSDQSEKYQSEKYQDVLAIESTCINVTGNNNSNKTQLQLNNIPKKLGRPRSLNASSGAERAKKSRDKKKFNKLVTVSSTLTSESSVLYNKMIESGYDLNSMINMAFNQASLFKN